MPVLSLTTRLTLFFTTLAAAIVLGLGLVFSWAASQHCLELDSATLQDKQHLITDLLQQSLQLNDAAQALEMALSHHHGFYVAITTNTAHILFKTPGFIAPLPGTLQASRPKAAHASPTPAAAPVIYTGQSPDGRRLRLMAFSLSPAFMGQQPLQVQLVVDAAHHAHFLNQLLQQMGCYALAAIALSGLLGWLAAHHALAPLRAMKAQAAGVSAQQLHPRMPLQAVPVEMAELAVELNGMLDRLQQDFNRLQDFSSDLAHELRTPLSNLLTQTQVILSSPRSGASYQEALASNAEELQRLSRMVQDMLFLAKTEHGQGLPKQEVFAAEADIQALLEFYEALAEEQHIQLQCQGSAQLMGDRLMFRRALSNLLANAFAHTPSGGKISLQLQQTQDAVVITLSNTGLAIPPESLPRLFDRFYRADPSRQHAASEGAGLGLAITKAIVDAHGGRVSVVSNAQQTCFSLVFPKVQGAGG